ncbi:MAG: hypothetical protein Q9218_003505, partial [Villophora microphyllina]
MADYCGCKETYTPKTYTITEPCTQTGSALPSDHMPSGFVVTTATCHVCAETPVIATFTTPAPQSPAATPAPAQASPTGSGFPPASAAPTAPGASSPPSSNSAPAAAPASPGSGSDSAPVSPAGSSSPGAAPAAGPAAKAPVYPGSPASSGSAQAPVAGNSSILPFTGGASICDSVYTVVASMSAQLKYQPQPRARSATDASLMARLKHWFNKGSELKAANKKKAALDVREFLQQQPAKMNPSTWNDDQQAAYDILNNTPRQIPRAVHAGARRVQHDESADHSSFSTLNTTPASSLTSAQSNRNPLDPRGSKGKKGKHSRPDISCPKPTDSLLNLASNYAD